MLEGHPVLIDFRQGSFQPKFVDVPLRIRWNSVYMEYLWSHEVIQNFSFIRCMASILELLKLPNFLRFWLYPLLFIPPVTAIFDHIKAPSWSINGLSFEFLYGFIPLSTQETHLCKYFDLWPLQKRCLDFFQVLCGYLPEPQLHAVEISFWGSSGIRRNMAMNHGIHLK